MKTLILIILALPTFAFSDCSDPFEQDCVVNAQTKSQQDMVVVCKNGVKIKPDGSTIAVDGTASPAGTVASFDQTQGNYKSLCQSVGSTFLAYGNKDSGNFKVKNNFSANLGGLGSAQPGTISPATSSSSASSSSSTSGGPGSCATACDCPNSMDACISGTCQTQSGTSCRSGTYVKGDAICQWKCVGGFWSCPSPPRSCR